MDTPRILAIDDVHLAATPGDLAELVAFYHDLIGLDRIDGPGDEGPLVFRGYPRSGPRLVVGLDGKPVLETLRRQVLIQVRCLTRCAEQLAERRTSFAWSHGWTFLDRRLIAFDPAGNRVELVAYHVL